MPNDNWVLAAIPRPTGMWVEVYSHGGKIYNINEAFRLMRLGRVPVRLKRFNICLHAQRFLREDGSVRARYRGWYINEARLDELRRYKSRLVIPGLVISDRNIVIDGNHRLCARYLSGLNTMPMLAVTYAEAELFGW